MKSTLFIRQLGQYFDTYLPTIKNCSQNTIASYADGFTVLFDFFQTEKGKAYYLIDYRDLTPQVFDEFVLWMQNDRQYSAGSQRQRMAAVVSFLKYAAKREMVALSALNSALSAKTPKVPEPAFSCFSVDEIKILFRLPRCDSSAKSRDRLMLCLLYDSGARVQELCDIRIGDISPGKVPKIKLLGKGRKAREIPISNEVEKLIKAYLKESGRTFTDNKSDYLFTSQRADKMTTACVRHVVNKYVQIAAQENPTMFLQGNYSPHSFRHSKAVHMLDAGVPLIYIRNFLGHESVSTTERFYAKVSQAAMTKALENRNLPKPDVESQPTAQINAGIPNFLEKARHSK